MHLSSSHQRGHPDKTTSRSPERAHSARASNRAGLTYAYTPSKQINSTAVTLAHVLSRRPPASAVLGRRSAAAARTASSLLEPHDAAVRRSSVGATSTDESKGRSLATPVSTASQSESQRRPSVLNVSHEPSGPASIARAPVFTTPATGRRTGIRGFNASYRGQPHASLATLPRSHCSSGNGAGQTGAWAPSYDDASPGQEGGATARLRAGSSGIRVVSPPHGAAAYFPSASGISTVILKGRGSPPQTVGTQQQQARQLLHSTPSTRPPLPQPPRSQQVLGSQPEARDAAQQRSSAPQAAPAPIVSSASPDQVGHSSTVPSQHAVPSSSSLSLAATSASVRQLLLSRFRQAGEVHNMVEGEEGEGIRASAQHVLSSPPREEEGDDRASMHRPSLRQTTHSVGASHSPVLSFPLRSTPSRPESVASHSSAASLGTLSAPVAASLELLAGLTSSPIPHAQQDILETGPFVVRPLKPHGYFSAREESLSSESISGETPRQHASSSVSISSSTSGGNGGGAPSLLESLTHKARARGRARGLAGVDGFGWLTVAQGLEGHRTPSPPATPSLEDATGSSPSMAVPTPDRGGRGGAPGRSQATGLLPQPRSLARSPPASLSPLPNLQYPGALAPALTAEDVRAGPVPSERVEAVRPSPPRAILTRLHSPPPRVATGATEVPSPAHRAQLLTPFSRASRALEVEEAEGSWLPLPSQGSVVASGRMVPFPSPPPQLGSPHEARHHLWNVPTPGPHESTSLTDNAPSVSSVTMLGSPPARFPDPRAAFTFPSPPPQPPSPLASPTPSLFVPPSPVSPAPSVSSLSCLSESPSPHSAGFAGAEEGDGSFRDEGGPTREQDHVSTTDSTGVTQVHTASDIGALNNSQADDIEPSSEKWSSPRGAIGQGDDYAENVDSAGSVSSSTSLAASSDDVTAMTSPSNASDGEPDVDVSSSPVNTVDTVDEVPLLPLSELNRGSERIGGAQTGAGVDTGRSQQQLTGRRLPPRRPPPPPPTVVTAAPSMAGSTVSTPVTVHASLVESEPSPLLEAHLSPLALTAMVPPPPPPSSPSAPIESRTESPTTFGTPTSNAKGRDSVSPMFSVRSVDATAASALLPPAVPTASSWVLPPPSPVASAGSAASSCVIRSYAGICEAGWEPAAEGAEGGELQPKVNQDAVVLEEHPDSDGLLMAVFDGHGEHGHLVARWFRQNLPPALWSHPAYNTFLVDVTQGDGSAAASQRGVAADNIPQLDAVPAAAASGHPWARAFTEPSPSDGPGGALSPGSASGLATGSVFPTPRTSAAPALPRAAPAAAGGRPPPPPVRRRDVGRALVESLAAVERSLLRAAADGSLHGMAEEGEPPFLGHHPEHDTVLDLSMSGCTACVAVAVGPHVTVVNVGDSRAVLVRSGGTPGGEEARAHPPAALTAWPVTVDHKPTLPGETRRILLSGGRLQPIVYADGTEGPVRVWLRDEDVPGLAMSRSFGDTLARRVGVIGTPDVYAYTLGPADAFLVLATDGLWEFTHPPTVARVLAETHAAAALAAAAHGGQDEQEEEPPSHLALALDALAELAGQRWREREGAQDDISILLAEVGTLIPAAE